MMLAANFQLEVGRLRRQRLVGGGGGGGGGGRRGRRSVTPEAELQILLSKQRLGQRQVEVRHATAVQHQDLIAGTQAFAERQPVGENLADEDAAVLLAVDVPRDGEPWGGGAEFEVKRGQIEFRRRNSSGVNAGTQAGPTHRSPRCSWACSCAA